MAELLTQQSLMHKNIVRVMGYCLRMDKGGKQVCIIMEILDGSLFDRVNALDYYWSPRQACSSVASHHCNGLSNPQAGLCLCEA